ncbi:MAG TPA: hypothetical protein IAC84_04670 [Firmicutes bacterium]|nr:hypothetical protein [Candidatus Enterenecus merdae]HJH62545.1 hypothetical protein [Bacillota bacterium]
MRGYPEAARGLGKLFLAQILMIVGVLTTPLLVGVILLLVGQVVYLIGLYQAKMDDEGYSGAFALRIISLIVSFLGGFWGESWMGDLFDLISNILGFVILYLVCSTTALLVGSLGWNDLARQGHTVWMINLVCTVISLACNLLMFIPVLNLLAIPVLLVTSIASLVGGVLFLVFLYRSSKALA